MENRQAKVQNRQFWENSQTAALLVNIVFQLQAADIPQGGEVRIEGFLLYWHILFVQKLFQFPPLYNAVSACVGFKVLFQQQTDGRWIMALLVSVLHADRFCEGTLLRFFESRTIEKWLLRLKEIDN